MPSPASTSTLPSSHPRPRSHPQAPNARTPLLLLSRLQLRAVCRAACCCCWPQAPRHGPWLQRNLVSSHPLTPCGHRVLPGGRVGVNLATTKGSAPHHRCWVLAAAAAARSALLLALLQATVYLRDIKLGLPVFDSCWDAWIDKRHLPVSGPPARRPPATAVWRTAGRALSCRNACGRSLGGPRCLVGGRRGCRPQELGGERCTPRQWAAAPRVQHVSPVWRARRAGVAWRAWDGHSAPRAVVTGSCHKAPGVLWTFCSVRPHRQKCGPSSTSGPRSGPVSEGERWSQCRG
jgi:hypothetical protein